MNTRALLQRALMKMRYPIGLGLIGGLSFLIKSTFQRVAKANLPGYQPIFVRTKASDILVFEHVFVTGEMDFLVKYMKGAKTIVDAGANTGFTAAKLAVSFPDAKIIALEPDESNFEFLLKNTQGYPNVTPLRAALWCDNSPLKVINPGKREHGYQVGPSQEGESVQSVPSFTVPDLIEKLGADRLDFLKIDIEGAEFEVFQPAAKEWIEKVGCVAIELHDKMKPGCAARFFRVINGLDFRFRTLGEKVIVKFEGKSTGD